MWWAFRLNNGDNSNLLISFISLIKLKALLKRWNHLASAFHWTHTHTLFLSSSPEAVQILSHYPNPLGPRYSWDHVVKRWGVEPCQHISIPKPTALFIVVVVVCTCFGFHWKIRLAFQDAVDDSGAVSIRRIVCVCCLHLHHRRTWAETTTAAFTFRHIYRIWLYSVLPIYL